MKQLLPNNELEGSVDASGMTNALPEPHARMKPTVEILFSKKSGSLYYSQTCATQLAAAADRNSVLINNVAATGSTQPEICHNSIFLSIYLIRRLSAE